jgi:hypothetical protein
MHAIEIDVGPMLMSPSGVVSQVVSQATATPTPSSSTQMTNQLLAYIQNNQNMAMEDNMQNQAISSRQAEQHEEPVVSEVHPVHLIPVSLPYSLASASFSPAAEVGGQQWTLEQQPQQYRIIGTGEHGASMHAGCRGTGGSLVIHQTVIRSNDTRIMPHK